MAFRSRGGPLLAGGDSVVASGNSYYKDSVRRGEQLDARGLKLLDTGTAVCVRGLEEGFRPTVGGPADRFEIVEPSVKPLALAGRLRSCGAVRGRPIY